jgi:hypothetical protein
MFLANSAHERYNGCMKPKREFSVLAVIALTFGIISASSYSIITTLFAAQTKHGAVLSDVVSGSVAEPMHAAAPSMLTAVDQFAVALVLILVGFGIGAYMAMRKKRMG